MYAYPETKASHPAYYAFRNELKALVNYPKKLRKVAISNGNFNRSVWPEVYRAPGSKILDFKIKFESAVDDTLFHTQLYDDPWTNSGTLIKQSFFGDTDRVENTLLGGGKRNYGSSPGSYLTLMDELNHRLEKKPDIKIGSVAQIQYVTGSIGESNRRKRTFIPTASALDLSTANLFYTRQNLDYGSPFDQVYTSGTHENLEHAQINQYLIDRLLEELAPSQPRSDYTPRMVAPVILQF